ncbi:hypothetical protein T265_15059, partial [Opisthorchis viverrini]
LTLYQFRYVAERWPKWLDREFTDRKVRGSNPTSASRLALSRLGQPGGISALVQPTSGMAVRHRKEQQPPDLQLANAPERKERNMQL